MSKAAKLRYFQKCYDNANVIECACGCGTMIKDIDRYGRSKRFISGHNRRKYQDPTQYKREWNYRNREKRYQTKVKSQYRRKQEFIQIKGGKCLKCQCVYNGKNGSIFQFHHRVPANKEFGINLQTMGRVGKKRMLKELEKCDLLCANCHFQIHSEEF